MMCKDPIQKGYGEVKWRHVTAGGSISVDVFLFSASFAIIFMPCGLNVPIHLRANGTFTAEIAGHCASHLFISSKRAEMACGLSGVGGGGTITGRCAPLLLYSRAHGPRGWKWSLMMSAFSNTTKSLLPYFKIIN